MTQRPITKALIVEEALQDWFGGRGYGQSEIDGWPSRLDESVG